LDVNIGSPAEAAKKYTKIMQKTVLVLSLHPLIDIFCGSLAAIPLRALRRLAKRMAAQSLGLAKE
jgi:hypothetical protein